MKENYKEIRFSEKDTGYWSIQFKNLNRSNQTLLTFCNEAFCPVLHLTQDGNELALGYHDGENWCHYKSFFNASAFNELDFIINNEEAIFYMDNRVVGHIPINLLRCANRITIGVSPSMVGDKKFLESDVEFCFQKEDRSYKYDYVQQPTNNYKEVDLDISQTQHWFIEFKNFNINFNQTLFCINKKQEDGSKLCLSHFTVENGKFFLLFNSAIVPVPSLIEEQIWSRTHSNYLSIDLYIDNHYLYVFLNNNIICFRYIRYIEEADELSIGVSEAQDGQYFLCPNVILDYNFEKISGKHEQKDKPVISLIIPAYVRDYGNFMNVINCIRNIQKYTQLPYEIILIDDGSKNDYMDSWSADSILFKDNLKLYINKANHGIPKSRNLGGLKAKGDILIFLDSDQFVYEGYDQLYNDVFLDKKKCIVGEHWKHDRIFYLPKKAYDDIDLLSYMNGAGLAIRREDFYSLGGFDEDFSPFYCEDSDFCWNSVGNGFTLVPLDLSLCIYHQNSSTVGSMDDSQKYHFLNNFKLINKYRDRFDFNEKKEEKKKILFLMNSTFIGGAENALSNVITTDKIEKHVIVLKEADTWIQDKVLKHADRFLSLADADVYKILFYCILNDIEIIVFNNFNYDLRFKLVDMMQNFLSDIKMVDVICDNWYWKSLEDMGKKINFKVEDYLENIDYFICKNKNMRAQCFDRNLYNVAVVYNGVDNSHNYTYLSNKVNSRFTAITVSRISHEKRLEIIFEAARQLPHLDFVVVGGPSGSVREAYYRRLLEDSDKIKNLTMAGELPKEGVLAELSKADIFVFTSQEEGCPNAVLEAMSVGLPTVALNVVGVNEIVDNNVGFLVEQQDEFIAIINSLSKKRDMLEEKSKITLEAVKNKFSIDTMINGYLDVFEKICSVSVSQFTQVKEKHRIAIMVPTLGVGGVEKIALDQLEFLRLQDLECDLWYFNDYYDAFEPKDHLKDFINKNNSSPRNFISHTDYDMYISHIIPASELLGLTKKKIINSVHSPSFWMRSNKDIEGIAQDNSLIYHFFSNFVYSMLAPYIYDNEFFILPHGVKKINDINKVEAKRKLHIDQNKFIISQIGKNSTIKNTHKAIDVFESFSKSYPSQFLLFGNMEISANNYDLDVISRIKENPDIVYLGVIQDNVQEYLMASDCYINTSWSEGLPISMLEALSVGVPCVSHNIGAVSEIIEDGYNGYLLSVNSSIDEFTVKIKMIQNIDCVKCIDKIKQNYSLEINLNEYKKIIQEIIEVG